MGLGSQRPLRGMGICAETLMTEGASHVQACQAALGPSERGWRDGDEARSRGVG